MSDGGAGAIVEVVSLLARSKVGRVILVVGAFWLTVQYVISQLSDAVLLGLLVIGGGVVALAIAYFVRRRRRQARASLYQWLAFLGLVVVAALGAIVLVFRRRKAAAPIAPPSQADVERLAALEGQP